MRRVIAVVYRCSEASCAAQSYEEMNALFDDVSINGEAEGGFDGGITASLKAAHEK